MSRLINVITIPRMLKLRSTNDLSVFYGNQMVTEVYFDVQVIRPTAIMIQTRPPQNALPAVPQTAQPVTTVAKRQVVKEDEDDEMDDMYDVHRLRPNEFDGMDFGEIDEPIVEYRCSLMKDMDDYTVPIHFSNVLSFHNGPIVSDHMFLVYTVYAIGLEYGFVCKKAFDRCVFKNDPRKKLDYHIFINKIYDARVLSTYKPVPIIWNKQNLFGYTMYLANQNNVNFGLTPVLLMSVDKETLSVSMGFRKVPNVSCLPFEVTILSSEFISRSWAPGDPIHRRLCNIEKFVEAISINIFKAMYDYLI